MSRVNIGHSSRLGYDRDTYADKLEESIGPMLYQLNPNQVNNCNSCLSVFGPRPSAGARSYGVSMTAGNVAAPAQNLVDVESLLSNRNVIASRCRDAEVNDIDVTKFHLQHARVCNDFLDPIATHLTDPAANYRGMAVNRFVDIHANPQAVLFENFSVNTHLEAIDNYRERIPYVRDYDPVLPRELKGRTKPCKFQCFNDCTDDVIRR